MTTSYTLDLNTGLTQVLEDGTEIYLYGNGRIAQYGANEEYFLGDALWSVRQLTDASGKVTLTRAYQPYGSTLGSAGEAVTSYGFTGEWIDSYTQFVYLRARWYAPELGLFNSKDPSSMEINLYRYAVGNPINQKDPSGYISGFEALAFCFDFHSVGHGIISRGPYTLPYFVTVQEALDICRMAYSQDAWNQSSFDLSGVLPTTGWDLFGWYVFEHKNKTYLEFDANQPLTRELSRSNLVNEIRWNYYRFGATPKGQFSALKFNYLEQGRCLFDYSNYIPITCVLGSFYYQVKTLDNGKSVGFRIDNRTDLESGTHIAGRFPGDLYFGSVEELFENGLIQSDDLLFEVMGKDFEGKKVVSILKTRNQRETGKYYDSTGGFHELGGGNLVQTYVWKENYNSCSPWITYYWGYTPAIKAWKEYQELTVSPYGNQK